MRFIPEFHFRPASSKLTAEWCKEAIHYYYNNTSNVNLLEGKDTEEIDAYSKGEFDMTPFKRMFKSLKKKLKQNSNPNTVKEDTSLGLDWTPLPLITTKLNAAVSVVHKIPIEINCKAIDPLAAKKKNQDLTFLKNKPKLEEDLQDISDRLMAGKVDLGTTKHSSIAFSDSPYGLDLNEPDELDVFVNLLYSLSVESAYETSLEEFYYINGGDVIKLLETKDHYKYGVSCHRAYSHDMTKLPEQEYIHPSTVYTPKSLYPDFRDNTHRYITHEVTPMELLGMFSSEIKNEKHLLEIYNEKQGGYCSCNGGRSFVDKGNWGTFKSNLIYMEVLTVDYIGIKRNKKGRATLTEDTKATERLWGQNTIGFWWLLNTDHFFGIHKLGYSTRQAGREAHQTFSTNIYRSQDTSAIELCIGENKKAQIAEIKLQHAIIKSLPAGKYIDLHFMRNALKGIQEEDNKRTIDDLISMALEQNIVVGDSQGMEGRNDGQMRPVVELTGGMRTEIEGYLRIIAQALVNIGNYTGINEQLTGQSANSEGLVGMQKLLINSSINALNYCNEALKHQYQRLFTIWAYHITEAAKAGGKPKEAIASLIGSKKASVIKGLDEAPLHTIGVKISLEQREEERQHFLYELIRQKDMGVIGAAEEYMLRSIRNPKDAFALLAVKEKQWRKRKEAEQERAYEQQQAMIEQQNTGRVQAIEQQKQGDIEKIYAKADAESKIIELASQLGLNAMQTEGLIKKALQDGRARSQTEKNLQTIQAKANAKQQEALGISATASPV